MKIYVAGPMTGKKDYNLDAFQHAKGILNALGHEAITPHDLNAAVWERMHPGDKWCPVTKKAEWGSPEAREMFLDDLRIVLTVAEAIVVLDDWEQSRGANIEVGIANLFQTPVYKIVWETSEGDEGIPYLQHLPEVSRLTAWLA